MIFVDLGCDGGLLRQSLEGHVAPMMEARTPEHKARTLALSSDTVSSNF